MLYLLILTGPELSYENRRTGGRRVSGHEGEIPTGRMDCDPMEIRRVEME